MSTVFKFEGRVIYASPVTSGKSQKGNDWTKQYFAVEIPDEKYPQKVYFEVFGKDKIEQFAIKMDETIRVDASVTSVCYREKWYTSVKAWKVTHLNNSVVNDTQYAQTSTPQQANETQEVDDLPF